MVTSSPSSVFRVIPTSSYIDIPTVVADQAEAARPYLLATFKELIASGAFDVRRIRPN